LAVEKIPYEIKEIANGDNFKRKYGQLLPRGYRKATFDKDIAFKNPDAEFLSFGHPLFEATLKWIEKYLYDELLKGGVFYDPDRRLNGEILYYEGTVKDGRGNIVGKKLFAFYIDEKTGEIKEINPSIIWDLKPAKNISISADIESKKSKILKTTLIALNKYKKELTEERQRQAKIKEKYGIKSLEHLIFRLKR